MHLPKRWKTTLRLAIFGGFLGLHRFYVGKTATAFLYLYTLGGCGIGWIYDIILILTDRFRDDQGKLILKDGSASLDAQDDDLAKKNRKKLEGIGAGLIFLGGLLALSIIVPVMALFRAEQKLGVFGGLAAILMSLAGIAVVKLGTMFLQECFAFRKLSDKPGRQVRSIRSVEAVDGMKGHDFENFCAALLLKNGFGEIEVTRSSGDQGVDILANKDGIKYAIQCKNYASKLGNGPVQEVSAGRFFYHCQISAVMTNSTFTTGAKELAKATGTLLWDRSVLQDMMNK